VTRVRSKVMRFFHSSRSSASERPSYCSTPIRGRTL